MDINEQALSFLIKVLSNKQKQTRIRCSAANILIGSWASPSIMKGALKDPCSEIRVVAVSALGNIKSTTENETILSIMTEMLEDENYQVKITAAEFLAVMGSAAAQRSVLTSLIQLLQNKEDRVRSLGASTLAHIGPEAANRAVLKTLLESALRDSSADVRFEASSAIGMMGKAAARDWLLNILLFELKKKNSLTRNAAILLLRHMGAVALRDDIVLVLTEIMNDPNQDNVYAAIALVKMGVDTAQISIAHFLENRLRLENDLSYNHECIAMIQCLGEVGPKIKQEAILCLANFLNPKAVGFKSDTIIEVIQALKKIGPIATTQDKIMCGLISMFDICSVDKIPRVIDNLKPIMESSRQAELWSKMGFFSAASMLDFFSLYKRIPFDLDQSYEKGRYVTSMAVTEIGLKKSYNPSLYPPLLNSIWEDAHKFIGRELPLSWAPKSIINICLGIPYVAAPDVHSRFSGRVSKLLAAQNIVLAITESGLQIYSEHAIEEPIRVKLEHLPIIRSLLKALAEQPEEYHLSGEGYVEAEKVLVTLSNPIVHSEVKSDGIGFSMESAVVDSTVDSRRKQTTNPSAAEVGASVARGLGIATQVPTQRKLSNFIVLRNL